MPRPKGPDGKFLKAARKAERRRRNDDMDGFRMKLAIPQKYLEDKEYEYRWINDDGFRVWDLTKRDDWDQVAADDIEGHDGASTVRRQVGKKTNGEPLFAQLVRKPKRFCDEDRAKKQRLLDETMDQLAVGKRGDPVNLGGGVTGYVATDLSIRDGRRS